MNETMRIVRALRVEISSSPEVLAAKLDMPVHIVKGRLDDLVTLGHVTRKIYHFTYFPDAYYYRLTAPMSATVNYLRAHAESDNQVD